jgi:predicted ATPase/class 3 adenylate cyclase
MSKVTGTASTELTMLFTDIEGSTTLLNRLGRGYAEVLAAHRDVLRTAFHRSGGRELGTEGDSFFVVFDEADDAVAAAAEGQQALESHRWPEGVAVRVRMGLHTGHAEPFEDNLVGFDVHLAARISATAHGGQVVVSTTTADHAWGRLPEGTSLVSLGVHRLKDIPDPQQLWQLTVPGLPTAFPSLRSLGAPGSLPTPPTPLVGREGETTALAALLGDDPCRLVTLTGPGGTGKTRVALATARMLSDRYAHGVHFVDLSGATETSVAWSTVAEVLGRSGDDPVALLDHLGQRRVLLVLDNLEQLRESAGELVATLIGGTGALRVLATSRRPLFVAGEQVYPVPTLGLPGAGDGPLTAEAAGRADAVRLFVQQARLSDPGFSLDDGNVDEVVALCRRLDGLPLALELAAARIRLLPPRALLGHLDEVLGLPLPGHPRRQQSLRATVAWSYGLVDTDQQHVFRCLAAFGDSGGGLDAVAAVAGTESALGPVSGLLDAALVRVDDDLGQPRVRLLHTVRGVARALAAAEDDLERAQERHARHYLGVAQHADDRLQGPGAVAARSRLELELDNLRSALDWSLGNGGSASGGGSSGSADRTEIGVRLCYSLTWFWYLTGYGAESRRWLEQASRAASVGRGPELPQLLNALGLLQLQQGQLEASRDVLDRALALWQEAGDRDGEALALNGLGAVHRALGEHERSRELLRESITVGRLLSDRAREATALTNLALLEIDAGNPTAAIDLLVEAEAIDVERGNAWGVAADRTNRVTALLTCGRVSEATAVLRDLAPSVEQHGDPDLALAVLDLVAAAAAQTGQHERALRLAACAAQQRADAQLAMAPPDVDFLESRLVLSRAAVGDVAPLEEEGRRLTVSRALAEALELPAG